MYSDKSSVMTEKAINHTMAVVITPLQLINYIQDQRIIYLKKQFNTTQGYPHNSINNDKCLIPLFNQKNI